MKRLVTLAACLAMLTFTGCSGILGGGLFGSGCNSGCNTGGSSLFGGGASSLFSDGPIRQFMRGDACDTCNSAAGQISPGFGAATCDACGGIAPASDPFAIPQGNPVNFGSVQPQTSFSPPQGSTTSFAPPQGSTTSFYPSDSGVSLGQPVLQNQGIAPIDPGSIYGSVGGFDGLSEPPGINQ